MVWLAGVVVRGREAGVPRRYRLLTVLALGVAALLGLSTTIAQAEPPKLVSYGSFSSQVSHPVGVAVEGSGDLFVSSLAPGESIVEPSTVVKLAPSGELLSPPFGSAHYSGAAVDHTNGDVYVLGEPEFLSSAQIFVYDPGTGAAVTSFEVPASLNFHGVFTAVQIATDAAGNVYLPVAPSNEVLEYKPSECLALPEPCTLTPIKTFTGSGEGVLKEPTGVVVDSAGNLWVAAAGSSRIVELDPTGTPVEINGKPVEISSEGVQSVALDGEGDVLAIVNNGADFCGTLKPPCEHLVEYSPTGSQLADVGAGNFGPFHGMLAVDGSSGRVYVTDGAKNLVWIFGPPTPPEVVNEFAAEVGTTEAKLGALVKAGGLATSYRFEYDTSEYTEGEGPHGQSTPFPEGSTLGVEARTVAAAASGLAPGTTYHYRVVVHNELGTVVGPDRTFTTLTAEEAQCSNEALRTGFSATLPDCRAYELVTPPNDVSAQPDTIKALLGGATHFEAGGVFGNFATPTGDRMSYIAAEVMPGATSSGYDYVSTRGANGWSSEVVIPPQSYTGDRCTVPAEPPAGRGATIEAYSSDLTKGIVLVGKGQSFGDPSSEGRGGCGAEGVEVVAGEPLGVENLLLRDGAGAGYRLLNGSPPGVTPTDARFRGASADLSRVFFTERAQLTPNALPGAENLYEWDDGALHLVTELPDGTPVEGSLAADWKLRPSVISADGTHVFSTTGGNLYLRLNGERTEQLDKPQGGSGGGGGGQFQGASADGAQAYFTDDASAGLTGDTVPGSGINLYRYANGQLSDLTAAEHAEVREVRGVSEDGSYVYFVASGVLPGTQANQHHETPQAERPNLYAWHAGASKAITFIATAAGDFGNSEARVSPSGAYLVFASTARLTGYDNTDTSTKLADPEIFLYSASSNALVCVSCNPSGERPSSGGAALAGNNGSAGLGAPHYLSNSGRVFFQTREGLLLRDTNDQIDVYEYEEGRQRLISSGTSSSESWLLDASENGNDVFFLSRQPLVPQDSSTESFAIYDARVEGGFPAPVSAPACTTADACRAPVSPQPSIYGAPSSQTFSGAGNLAPKPTVKPKKKPKKKACKRIRNKHKRSVCESHKKKPKKKAKHHRGGK
jgi:hypothetical protein